MHRFNDNLSKFVERKKGSMQGFLCDTKESEKALVSNFYRAIQFDIGHYQTMETIVYAKYIYERMEMDSKQIVHAMTKSIGQGIDVSFLNEVEPLIWMLIQARHRLKVSSLVTIGLDKDYEMVSAHEQYDPKLNVTVPLSYHKEPNMFDLMAKYYDRVNRDSPIYTSDIVSGSTKAVDAHILGDSKIISKNSAWGLHFENMPIQSLPEFQRNIQLTLPCRNPDIQRRIVDIVIAKEGIEDSIEI